MARYGRLPSGLMRPRRDGHCYGNATWATDWRRIEEEPLDEDLALLRGKHGVHRPRTGVYEARYPPELRLPGYHVWGTPAQEERQFSPAVHPHLGLVSGPP
jgi:hypothetical protein